MKETSRINEASTKYQQSYCNASCHKHGKHILICHGNSMDFPCKQLLFGLDVMQIYFKMCRYILCFSAIFYKGEQLKPLSVCFPKCKTLQKWGQLLKGRICSMTANSFL